MTGANTHIGSRLIPVMAALLALVASACAIAQGGNPPGSSTPGLSEVGLEQLLNMDVTSVSKHEQKLIDSAAAIYVITQDDIRRIGAASIAEALRIVPGMQVGRVTSNTWSIGARGFCDVFSNKLLVLVDGRSVYSPLMGGVVWDTQDLMMDDIDRIEVIRGPGATLWGANAVNGIVNVVTKDAYRTQGALVTLGAASAEQTQTQGVRVGGLIGKNAHFRVYTKGMFYNGFLDSTGHELADQWEQGRSGFRLDYDPSDQDSFTFQGDTYNENGEGDYTYGSDVQPFTRTYLSDITSSGWNSLLRWTKSKEDNSKLTLQVYVDEVKRNDPFLFGETTKTIDMDYQRELHPGATSTVVWGFGYRNYKTLCDDGYSIAFKYDQTTNSLYSAFAQTDHAGNQQSIASDCWGQAGTQ